MKINWKKELRDWGILFTVVAVLYATGLHTEVIGFMQRLLLSTGLMNPEVAQVEERPPADYRFQLQTLSGEKVPFDRFKGKTVFLNFWATWCPPCLAEMPSIQSLYEQADTTQVAFVLVTSEEDPTKPQQFIAKKGYTLPVYQLASPLPRVYRHTSIPTTLVISPQGEVVYRKEGMAKYDSPQFQAFLEGL